MVETGFLLVYVVFPVYSLGLLVYRTLKRHSWTSSLFAALARRVSYELHLIILGAFLLGLSFVTLWFAPWEILTLALLAVVSLLIWRQVDRERFPRKWYPNLSLELVGATIILLIGAFPNFITIGISLGTALGAITLGFKSKVMYCQVCEKYKPYSPFLGARYCKTCQSSKPMVSTLPPMPQPPSESNVIVLTRTDTPPIESAPCQVCGKTMATDLLNCEGECKNVRVSFEGMPCLSCRDDDKRKSAFGGFTGRLLEDVVGGIAATPLTGLRQGNLCSRCNTPLDYQPIVRTLFTVMFHWKNVDAFRAKVIVPAVRCSSCNLHQRFRSKMTDSDLTDAIENALRHAKLT